MSTRPAPRTPATAPTAAGPSQPDTRPAWTAESIRALGATTSLTTAGHIFGLSRATTYRLARTGRFPVPILRVGGQYRVPVAPILTALYPTTSPGDKNQSPPGAAPDLTRGRRPAAT